MANSVARVLELSGIDIDEFHHPFRTYVYVYEYFNVIFPPPLFGGTSCVFSRLDASCSTMSNSVSLHSGRLALTPLDIAPIFN